jgi:uncharacterized protein (DUF2141 family)
VIQIKVVPHIGQQVMYVLWSGRFAPAIITRVNGDDSVNLTVFGDPSDGGEFKTGAASRMNVPQWDSQKDGGYPETGMWFRPTA